MFSDVNNNRCNRSVLFLGAFFTVALLSFPVGASGQYGNVDVKMKKNTYGYYHTQWRTWPEYESAASQGGKQDRNQIPKNVIPPTKRELEFGPNRGAGNVAEKIEQKRTVIPSRNLGIQGPDSQTVPKTLLPPNQGNFQDPRIRKDPSRIKETKSEAPTLATKGPVEKKRVYFAATPLVLRPVVDPNVTLDSKTTVQPTVEPATSPVTQSVNSSKTLLPEKPKVEAISEKSFVAKEPVEEKKVNLSTTSLVLCPLVDPGVDPPSMPVVEPPVLPVIPLVTKPVTSPKTLLLEKSKIKTTSEKRLAEKEKDSLEKGRVEESLSQRPKETQQLQQTWQKAKDRKQKELATTRKKITDLKPRPSMLGNTSIQFTLPESAIVVPLEEIVVGKKEEVSLPKPSLKTVTSESYPLSKSPTKETLVSHTTSLTEIQFIAKEKEEKEIQEKNTTVVRLEEVSVSEGESSSLPPRRLPFIVEEGTHGDPQEIQPLGYPRSDSSPTSVLAPKEIPKKRRPMPLPIAKKSVSSEMETKVLAEEKKDDLRDRLSKELTQKGVQSSLPNLPLKLREKS
ncbi:MAG: hypothetical protein MPJ24_04280 [Pirellulaceae bacterium]|nr:hypothetical protein [Pirellulaceae bacterium]